MALLKFLQHRGAGFGLAGILLHARCPLAVERLAVTQSQPISPSSCLLGLSLCLLLSSFAIDALDLSSRSRHATAHFPKFPASTLYSRSQVKSSQSVSQSVISRSRPALTPPPARSPAPPLPVEHKYEVPSTQVKSSQVIGRDRPSTSHLPVLRGHVYVSIHYVSPHYALWIPSAISIDSLPPQLASAFRSTFDRLP